jgi:hypothetical protein
MHPNRPQNAFKEQKNGEAEEWLSGSFSFANLHPNLSWLTEKMHKQYQIVVKVRLRGQIHIQ